MPNKYYNNMNGANFPKKEGAPTGQRGSKGPMVEKTVSYPGLPGKAGPDRSAGVKKCKCYPVSQGI